MDAGALKRKTLLGVSAKQRRFYFGATELPRALSLELCVLPNSGGHYIRCVILLNAHASSVGEKRAA